jgi:hypothetical protein
MKRLLIVFLLLSPLLQAAHPFFAMRYPFMAPDLIYDYPNLVNPTIYLYLRPDERCTQVAVDQLNGAKRQVLVQAYSLTSVPIDRALVDAHKRGVDVQVILDKNQKSETYFYATFLANEGVPIYIDPIHEIAHEKFMVIDGKTIITFIKSEEKRPFFNFIKSAAQRLQRLFDKPNPFRDFFADSVLFIHGPSKEAAQYTDKWKEHLGHSFSYH